MTAGPDPGLPRERTSLAWRRTSLAVLLGGIVSVRLLPPAFGTAGLLVASLLLGGAALLAVAVEVRGRRLRRLPTPGAAPVPAAGAVTALLAGAVTATSVGAGALVLHGG